MLMIAPLCIIHIYIPDKRIAYRTQIIQMYNCNYCVFVDKQKIT